MVNLTDVQRNQSIIRGPTWPSIVLCGKILKILAPLRETKQ